MHIALITDSISTEKEIGDKSLLLFEKSLTQLGYSYDVVRLPEMNDMFFQGYRAYDLAIPVVHGGRGEGGQISAMCEILGIPYLFADYNIHVLCFDKYLTNLIVKEKGYTIPETSLITMIDECAKISFDGPYFVKPNSSGSSIDCGKFDTLEQAKPLIQKILSYDAVLIQKAIKGRELTVSLKGDYDKNIEVVGIMEVLTDKEFFDYDAKYKWDRTKEIFPDLPALLEKELILTAITIYKACRVRDLARIDFLYDGQVWYFLEVNTIPGMTEKSFYPQCIAHVGYKSFADFLDELIKKENNSSKQL